jgi:formylglycine-generating enzyme required for sulfatase activity
MNFDAFISYANQDKATADAACAKLEAEGIRCWIAPRDVPPGAQWAEAIVDAIDHCRAMVVIFSSNANASKQIHREVQRAFEREVPVVPFRIENVAPEKSLAYYMGPVHWLDALTPPLEQHLQKLVVSVKPFAHSKTFDERGNEERSPQEAELDKSAEVNWSWQPEPRKPWRPSRWSVLTLCVLGAALAGSVGVWLGNTYWRPVPSGQQPVPSSSPPAVPQSLTPPAPTPAQASATPAPPAYIIVGPLSLERERALKPKDSFKECDKCPEMVVVSAGSFTMGSPDNEKDRNADEGPQHLVTIRKPFAAGKFEVTVDQFAAFVAETSYDYGSECNVFEGARWGVNQNRTWRNPGFPQIQSDPAICLNWNDAKAYVDWLARETGKTYRLLSEAEWEYAARAQTEPGAYPRYPFGNSEKDLCQYANWGDQTTQRNIPGAAVTASCDDHYAYTSPVGSFAANGFGLYDMEGNAWEWTEDCYHNSYEGAPSDGRPWISGNCRLRVLRGGCWLDAPSSLRSAGPRDRDAIDWRASVRGFRVARTLTP